MDDRPFSVTLVKDDWDLVLNALRSAKRMRHHSWNTKSNALSAE